MAAPLLKGPVDLNAYGHQVISLVGKYRVQTIKVGFKPGRGKQKRVALLLVDPQTVVDLEDRPEEELDRLAEQQVVVTGRLILPVFDEPDEVMAQPDELPLLLEIASVVPFGE